MGVSLQIQRWTSRYDSCPYGTYLPFVGRWPRKEQWQWRGISIVVRKQDASVSQSKQCSCIAMKLLEPWGFVLVKESSTSTRMGKWGPLFIPPFPSICTFAPFLSEAQERCLADSCQVVTLTLCTLGRCLEVAWFLASQNSQWHSVLVFLAWSWSWAAGMRTSRSFLIFPWGGQIRPAMSPGPPSESPWELW